MVRSFRSILASMQVIEKICAVLDPIAPSSSVLRVRRSAQTILQPRIKTSQSERALCYAQFYSVLNGDVLTWGNGERVNATLLVAHLLCPREGPLIGLWQPRPFFHDHPSAHVQKSSISDLTGEFHRKVIKIEKILYG
jgi:hypothetical protein